MLIVGYLEVGKFFEWAAESVVRRAVTPDRLLSAAWWVADCFRRCS